MGYEKQRRPILHPDSDGTIQELRSEIAALQASVTALGLASDSNRSATEASTGLTDIVGDTIYVKTLVFAAGPNNSTVNVAHGITGLKALVKFEGFMTNDTLFRNINNIEATSTASCHYAMDGTNVILVSGTGGDYSGYDGTITLYYTKA